VVVGDRRKQVSDALGRIRVLDPAIRQLRRRAEIVAPTLGGHSLKERLVAVMKSKDRGAAPTSRAGDRIGVLAFRCNICGSRNERPVAALQREERSCDSCGSTVRWRGVIHALSTTLFSQSLAIRDFPSRPDIVAWGLSDWEGYAIRLAEKFSYTNTFYHTEPRVDITNISSMHIGTLDVLISSDVFEHVPPPVGNALSNARQLLKSDGALILTVPYDLQPETIEHFPNLHDFAVEGEGDDRRLLNITVDGERETFSNLTFHGGAGSTLEMRIFSKDSLLADLHAAGFSRIAVLSDPCFEHGVFWWESWSLPIVAQP
jgi:SAM-dependent methyltransferase